MPLTYKYPITFEKMSNTDNRYVNVKLWLCHTGKNLNDSYFSKEVLTKMKDNSLANLPIVGYIKVDENNRSDYSGHDWHIVVDDNGVKLEYLAQCYGIIPQNHNGRFEKKICTDNVEREFLVCDGLLFKRFDKCIEIFNRDINKKQSIEIDPDSIQGKTQSDGLFHFAGGRFWSVCILGNSKIEAMTGSLIEKTQFIHNIKNNFAINSFDIVAKYVNSKRTYDNIVAKYAIKDNKPYGDIKIENSKLYDDIVAKYKGGQK